MQTPSRRRSPASDPPSMDNSQLTSFPEDNFHENNDTNGLSNFYSRITNAVSNVLPSKDDDTVLSSSPFTGAKIQALHQQRQQQHQQQQQQQQPIEHNEVDSPLKYLQDDVSIISSLNHKASPSLGGIHWETNDDPADERPMPMLSRTASVNTSYSYNIRDHLPGYAVETDPSSDSESIVSTRDYIIANIDPRMNRSGGLGKEFWMKDENATECFKCTKPFTSMYFCLGTVGLTEKKKTAWRRKHHCRLCGQIFCSSCTELIPGDRFNYPGRMRACANCLDVIDKYTTSSSNESSTELNTVEHDTLNPIEISFNSAPRPTPIMAIPATRKGESLEIFPSIEGSPRSQSSRMNLKEDDYDVTIESESEESEEDEQAMSLFTALQPGTSTTIPTSSEQSSSSRTFLRPRSSTGRSTDGRMMKIGINQRRESTSTSRKLLPSRSSKNGLRDVGSSPRKNYRTSSVVQAPSVDLNKASSSHAKSFLQQLLWNYGLSDDKWMDVLMDPLIRCSQNIDLDVRGGDNIDIRHYVKIKRIPGGTPKDVTYIDGIVFSKTLALKTMPHLITNPRILLVTFPIEYSRTDQHFMSLEPVLAQEREYLKKLVQRIVFLNPQIVLAGERVSGIAIQLLAQAGIAVIPNVNPNIINRVARYTQADIISSIDKLATNPRLGKCQHFEVKSYKLGDTFKTYLFFRGIPQELGCTILLRGGDMDTLAEIKAIVEFMVFVVFNLKLETSLMRDQFVLVPSQDSEPSPSRDEETGYFHDLIRQQSGKIMSSSPFVHFGNPYLLKEARDLEDQLVGMERENVALDFSNADEIQSSFARLGLKFGIEQLPNGEKTDLVVAARELVKAVNGERRHRFLEQWNILKRQWELSYSQAPYMFSASSHQNIVTLFSVVNKETTTPCIGPEQLVVDYYSENDMTLGQFVEQACFTTNEPCPDGCGRTWSDHYRSYVNGTGRINVVVENFECRLPGLQNTILMWSYCKECQNTMPVMPMSSTTWKYSFGKYLELSFYSSKVSFRAGMCSHNIYRDHIRYFGFQDLAVRFEFDTIDLLEVLVPRPRISWQPEREVEHKLDLYNSIAAKITKFYASVLSRLESVIVENVASDKVEECREKTEELKQQCEVDKIEGLQLLRQVYLSTEIDEILPLNGVIRDVQDSVVKWDAEFTDFENNYFPSEKDITRITTQQLKKIFIDKDEQPENEEKVSGSTTPAATSTTPTTLHEEEDLENSSELTKSTTSLPTAVEKPGSPLPLQTERGRESSPSESSSRGISPTKTTTKVKEAAQKFEQQQQADESLPRNSTSQLAQQPHAAQQVQPSQQASTSKPSSIPTLVKRPITAGSSKSNPERPSFRKKFSDKIQYPAHTLRQRFGSSTRELERQLLNSSGTKQTKVSSLAKHFDQLSREFEKERARERTLMAQGRVRAFPVARARPIVEVFKNVQEAVEDSTPNRPGSPGVSSQQQNRQSIDKAVKAKNPQRAQSQPRAHSQSSQSQPQAQLQSQPQARPPRQPQPQPQPQVQTQVQAPPSQPQAQPQPLPPSQSQSRSHSQSQPQSQSQSQNQSQATTPQDDKKIEIKDKEPKEVAPMDTRNNSDLTLADSQELTHIVEKSSLMQTLTRFWADRSSTGWIPLAYPLHHTEHVFAESDIIVREDEPSSLIAFCLGSADYIEKVESLHDNVQLEDIMLKKTGTHLKYQFQEGSAMLSCKIFYAEQFNAFRKQCACDSNYIQSLSRCVKWDSSGGKSGSAFLKTLDDRLVVKELSPSELEAFLKFAPSYFEYMAQAFFHDLPTVLAKIFGFYQIQIRNPITGKTIKMDLIVMENLFYNRKMTRIFDLKGSMRNRHVQQTGKENEVLLDENMVEYIYESPLFVREYAKRLLRTSLFNDTLFLAKMNVMDYSLVIGIDEEKKQLVVGIIDFIRTFTWDKKLESWVKERGLVGGGVKEPTVVSPKQYKNRFREAMERYVLMVPDCWYQDFST